MRATLPKGPPANLLYYKIYLFPSLQCLLCSVDGIRLEQFLVTL